MKRNRKRATRRSELMLIVLALAMFVNVSLSFSGISHLWIQMTVYRGILLYTVIRDRLFTRDIDRDEDKARVAAHPMDITLVVKEYNSSSSMILNVIPHIDTSLNELGADTKQVENTQWGAFEPIDILSIGSNTRAQFLEAQVSTWAQHRSVRFFWGFTEDIDLNQTCHAEGNTNQVTEYIASCKAYEGWRYEVRQLVKNELMQTEGEFMSTLRSSKTKRGLGWFCAQRRVGRALRWLEQVYIQRDLELPNYVLVVDDDTYFDFDHFFHEFPRKVNLDPMQSNMISGCMIRRSFNIPWNMPYGGFGVMYTRAALQNMFRPIFCKANEKKMDKFSLRSCRSLEKNRIGERALFTEGMTLVELLHDYVALHFLCFHSDWLQGYFAEFYLNEEEWVGSNAPAMMIWPFECGNVTHQCRGETYSCHRQGPIEMAHFTRQAMRKSPQSFRHDPTLARESGQVHAKETVSFKDKRP